MSPLSRALARANRQHRVITTRQLRACGLSKDAIEHLVARGRLVRLHRGVYAFEGPLSRDGQVLAAVAACADGVGAGFGTAAWVLGITRHWPRRLEMVGARTGASGPRGIVLHHSTTLTEADFTSRRGIRTTAPKRTIRDCAPLLGSDALRTYLQNAERQGLDLRALDEPRIPANLRAALDRYVRGSGLTANELEARFFEICVRAGLPVPSLQSPFGDRRAEMFVDFVWRDLGLVVETDGRDGHGGWVASAEDRRRDRWLVAAGYTVLRFTWTEVRYEPEMVARELVAAHRRLHGKGGS